MIVRLALLLVALLLVPLRSPGATEVDSGSDSGPSPAGIANPLEPADTSSPRDTLLDFMANMDKALQAWESWAPRETVKHYAELAFQAFDLSQLPDENRFVREVEIALYLKEILDRIPLPPADEIPGDDSVDKEHAPISSWTIPNTSISLTRVKDGPRAGEFLVTPETVDKIAEFYERAKQLPYKSGAMVGVLEKFHHSPGFLLPHALVAALPDWSRIIVFGQAIWQWLTLAFLFVATWTGVRALLRWGRRWDKRHRNVETAKRFGTPLAILASVALLLVSRIVLVYGTKFIGGVWDLVSAIILILAFVGGGWFVIVITGRFSDAINAARQSKEGSIDSQLVRVVMRLVSLVVLVCLTLYAADFFGVPLAPVVASLGVGGLAIALAVRPTLENIIGGLTLFADKPVRIGDFCRYGEDEATVEAIGLRSTRLRKMDDTLVSIPNADFSQRELVNLTQRRQRLYRTTLGLRYETTAEQLRYVIAQLREMLLGHPMVSPQKLHVRFDGFGAYSLDVEVFAYIRTKDWLEYRAAREDINFRIIDIVNDAGTGFAFPSQTTYIGRDSGLDSERTRAAEAAVAAWRTKGQLPFPEFDPALQWEKEDTLDYPPQGSPGHVQRRTLAEPSPQAANTPPPVAAPPIARWKRLLRRHQT
jgi:Small-conductance mechanosensitive channel